MVNTNLKQNDRMDVNNLPSTEQGVKTQPKQDKSVSLIFHRFDRLSVTCRFVS